MNIYKDKYNILFKTKEFLNNKSNNYTPIIIKPLIKYRILIINSNSSLDLNCTLKKLIDSKLSYSN